MRGLVQCPRDNPRRELLECVKRVERGYASLQSFGAIANQLAEDRRDFLNDHIVCVGHET